MRPNDVGSVGEHLYSQLAPLAYADEQVGWHLLIYCGALGRMRQTLHDLVTDKEDRPGWADLLDVDRCPAQYLPYLAQIVGARIPVGTPENLARDIVRTPSGFKRGTREAMIAAAKPYLTHTKTVRFIERTGGHAYRFTVVTKPSETPDPAPVEKALLAQKPAGLIMTYIQEENTIIDELVGHIDAQVGHIDDL